MAALLTLKVYMWKDVDKYIPGIFRASVRKTVFPPWKWIKSIGKDPKGLHLHEGRARLWVKGVGVRQLQTRWGHSPGCWDPRMTVKGHSKSACPLPTLLSSSSLSISLKLFLLPWTYISILFSIFSQPLILLQLFRPFSCSLPLSASKFSSLSSNLFIFYSAYIEEERKSKKRNT